MAAFKFNRLPLKVNNAYAKFSSEDLRRLDQSAVVQALV
jgi:hypothetical protein